MSSRNGSTSSNRFHIVLVPGFGGFDALGQVEYYARVTSLFQKWRDHKPVVLHYFDNLPTAAVTTRAARLRTYLAKRMARGEILQGDKLSWWATRPAGSTSASSSGTCTNAKMSSFTLTAEPAWPANRFASAWMASYSFPCPTGAPTSPIGLARTLLARAVIADLRAAVAGSQVYLLDEIESLITKGAACLTDAELLLALQDALTEANEHYGKPGPSRTADAQEANSELALYFRLMTSDFHAIDDLTSQPHDPDQEEPGALRRRGAQERTCICGTIRRSHLVVCDGGRPPVPLPLRAVPPPSGSLRTHSPTLRLLRTPN